ncbi:hypothetical protein GPECTOR_1g174 [Gonium pectorale]|uniref:Uncharacterized protein n=1 Tax=Gonium pectorale TaxID=33097 RepID=A0A150H270_GONPE|nr:hypothetical protein GPECTOR_1g174 [Gonium pectorale]|eukprot:KXZ56201.1 hypothetical protein GPECTOR_1g174 [Gonium pectorale]
MVSTFYQVAGTAADIVALSSGMLLISAIAMPVVPDLIVAVVALVAFTWSIFQTPCSPLPTIAFMGLLCVTAVFGAEASGKKTTPATEAAGTVAAESKTPTKGGTDKTTASNTTPLSSRKKRRG